MLAARYIIPSRFSIQSSVDAKFSCLVNTVCKISFNYQIVMEENEGQRMLFLYPTLPISSNMLVVVIISFLLKREFVWLSVFSILPVLFSIGQ